MVIGVPKEIKTLENRVALTPGGVESLVKRGHTVLVERGAGEGSGLSDAEYARAGAELVGREEAWGAEMVVKVKEPLPEEYGFLREGLILFTYLHLAADRGLTEAMLRSGVTGIAYETVQLPDGTLPLLVPMSEVAGRMAPQVGAQFLEKPKGGRGVLLGGVPGVAPASVVILGGGTVGTNAAKIALGMGAQVTILDVNHKRLQYLDDVFGGRVVTLTATEANIKKSVQHADLLIGAVLVPGAKAPKLVTRDMLPLMKEGAVIVDVAVDQGGVRGDHPAHHPRRAHLRGGRGGPLRGGQHARGGAQDQHLRPHQPDPALRAEARGEGPSGPPGGPRPSQGAQHPQRPPHPPRGGRGLRPALHASRGGLEGVRVPGRVVLTEAALASLLALVAHEVPGVVGMAPASLKDQVGRILRRQEAGEGVVVRPDPQSPGRYQVDLYVVLTYGTRVPALAEALGERLAYAARHLGGVELSQVRVHVVGVRCG